MKKILILITSLLAVIGLSGCGGYDDYRVDYENYDSNNLTTLFLVDEYGYPEFKSKVQFLNF